MDRPDIPLEAGFVDGSNGRLFVIGFTPPENVGRRATLLLLPPFAEEMNRSRRMLATTGRALAARGIRLMLADLSGTGDSEGQFQDASWESWIADTACLRSLAHGGEPLWLGGLRTGALLAADSIKRDPSGVAGAFMIQPVKDGARFLNQFLRLRIAVSMGRGVRESTGSIMEKLKSGETVTIAGYRLSPRLALELSALRMDSMPPPGDLPVDWIEIGSDATDGKSASASMAEGWETPASRFHYIYDQAFWALHDPVAPPAIVALIADSLESRIA